MKTSYVVLAVYVIVIIGAIIYFGFLQQFGFKGLLFQIEGRDHIIDPVDALIIIATIVAIFLFAISLLAYSRTRDTRILIVSLAFFFFAVKEFLFLFENFFPGEFIYIDNAERTLELLILLSFMMLMYGTYRKRARKRTRPRKI